MPTVVVTHRIPQTGLRELLERYEVKMPADAAFDRETLQKLLPGADAVLAGGALDGELIRSAPHLKIISNYGAGYDRVDVAAATACGIPVTNIPDATAEATAELTMALLLSVMRRVGEMNLRLRQEPPESLFGIGQYMGHTLRGKRLGILGLGHIGRAVARMAQAFGMTVCYYSRHAVPDAEAACYAPTLEALMRQSDVLTLHCPLTEETRGLLNGARLRLLPHGAVVINTARGGVLDYDALTELLEEGYLAGAGLDVFPDEPYIPAWLLALPQVVVTPHIGTNTVETRDDMARAASLRILQALEGLPLTQVVNPDYCKHRKC